MAASLTFISATINSATMQYSASGYSLPAGSTGEWIGTEPASGSTWTQTRTVKTYTNITYKWSFGKTGASGTHTFTGLNAGARDSINASVDVTCTLTTKSEKRTRTREWIPGTPATETEPATEGKWGAWSSPSESGSSTTTYTIASDVSASRVVYTKPSTFSWSGNIVTNATIELNLSASDWNALCDKAAQRINWKNQNGNANTSSAKVSREELISASKYNLLAGYLDVSSVRSGDLIKASLFTALSTAVNA